MGSESYGWVPRKMAEAGNQIGSPTKLTASSFFSYSLPESLLLRFALQPLGGVPMEKGEEEPRQSPAGTEAGMVPRGELPQLL